MFMVTKLANRIKGTKKRKPLSEMEEHELLCTRVGAALFLCQLVESTLRTMVDRLFEDQKPVRSRKKKYIPMSELVERLGRRKDVPRGLIKSLREFCTKRNTFVHRLFNYQKADTTTHDGRMICAQMAGEVLVLAGGLMRALNHVHADYLLSQGYSWGGFLRTYADALIHLPVPFSQSPPSATIAPRSPPQ
jgi:hypothetical protein